MNPIHLAPVRGAGALAYGAPTGNGSAPPMAAGALPPPGPMSGEGINDAMAMLYSLISKQASSDLATGENAAAFHKNARAATIKVEREALKREQEAQSGGDGFFSCIGRIVGDFSKNVATCRYDKVYSDLKDDGARAWNSHQFWAELASGASKVMKTAQTWVATSVAYGLGGPAGAAYIAKNPDSPEAKYCAMAGQAALTVATAGGAGAIAVAVALSLSLAGDIVGETQCFHEKSGWVSAGLSTAGAVVGTCAGSGQGVEALDKGAKTAITVANATKAGTQIASGAATARLGHFDAVAQDARADAKEAKLMAERIQKWIEMTLDGIKELKESHQRALEAVQGAMQTNDQTLLSVGAMKG